MFNNVANTPHNYHRKFLDLHLSIPPSIHPSLHPSLNIFYLRCMNIPERINQISLHSHTHARTLARTHANICHITDTKAIKWSVATLPRSLDIVSVYRICKTYIDGVGFVSLNNDLRLRWLIFDFKLILQLAWISMPWNSLE